MPRHASSTVTGDTLAALRASADRCPFLDPVAFRKAQTLLPHAERLDPEWLPRITGRPVTSWTQLAPSDIDLAVKAAEADDAYFSALTTAADTRHREAARAEAERDKAARQAARDQWEALRARLPVTVTVSHNWTARHLDGYEQGADHIVVLEAFTVGRLHRKVHQCLCETPSRARQLRHVSGNVGDENRVPDCKACLRTAETIATGNPS